MGPCIFILVFVAFLGTPEGKSIDEILMEAAPKSADLDVFHMSPDGDVMMMTELDILMDIKQYMEINKEKRVSRDRRKAIRSTKYRWKDHTVYYQIDQDFYSKKEQSVIKSAFTEWSRYTCLSFKVATSKTKDKIAIRKGMGGCYSRLGRVGGTQELGLQKGCIDKGVIIHEIGHSIGWFHEQARPDRDHHIRVNLNVIPQSWHSQFKKYSSGVINTHSVPYDYRSIMHYSGNAVVPMSIQTLDPDFQKVIGQRKGLSFRDIMLANIMYECPAKVCPESNPDCSQYGVDAFMHLLDGQCCCVCPTTSDSDVLKMCDPITTTTTSTTNAPVTTTTPATTTPRTTPKPPPKECVDLRPDCQDLADQGECKMDMSRMDMYCPKTCGFCDKEKMMCVDYEPLCPTMAQTGFCADETFGPLMVTKCPKSCKICQPVDMCKMQEMLGLDVVPDSTGSAAGLGVSALGATVIGPLLVAVLSV